MTHNPFIRHTDPAVIRQRMDAYMRRVEGLPARFLATIFSREHRPGGLIYEGHAPMAACQIGNQRVYSLTHGTSNYTQFVTSLDLSKIEYIEELIP